MDDTIIGEVLQAEKACSAEIERAKCRCRERIAGHRQTLERELAAVKERLQGAHKLKLEAELEACRRVCNAELEEVSSMPESLLQDAALCAGIQNCIIDIILEP